MHDADARRMTRMLVAGVAALMLASAAGAVSIDRYLQPRPGDGIEFTDLAATCLYQGGPFGGFLSCGRNQEVEHPGSHFLLTVACRYIELRNLATGRRMRINDNLSATGLPGAGCYHR